MTTAISPLGPESHPGFPLAGHIPEPPADGHTRTDLARACAELSAEIDPGEQMRLSFPDVALCCDAPMLKRALGSIFRYMLGRGLRWVCVDAEVTAPGWIGITVHGDAGAMSPSRLQPQVKVSAREVLGLDELATPEQGFLGLHQRPGGLSVSVHMSGQTLREDDITGDTEFDYRRYAEG